MNTNDEKKGLVKYEQSEQSVALAKIEAVNDTLSKLDGLITNTTSSIANIVQITGNVKIAMKSLDNEIERFRINAQKDIILYEKELPMWEKQLDRIQDRIDKAMDRILSFEPSDFSEMTIQRQKICLDALIEVNNTFNTMILKLMTR